MIPRCKEGKELLTKARATWMKLKLKFLSSQGWLAAAGLMIILQVQVENFQCMLESYLRMTMKVSCGCGCARKEPAKP